MPTYDYEMLARLSSLSFGTIMEIIPAYLTKIEYDNDPSEIYSEEGYYAKHCRNFKYLRDLIDSAIENKLIHTYKQQYVAYECIPDYLLQFEHDLSSRIEMLANIADSTNEFDDVEDDDIEVFMITTASFVDWAIRKKIPIPKVFVDLNLPGDLAAVVHKLYAGLGAVNENKSVEVPNPAYEDIMADETILKLKELPLPQLKQQVAMLAAEKKKWDASIMAAAKIGLLFCEEGSQKPVTEDKFISEYKKHLDKFPALPDTTLKRIYKNLPDGYRFSREGGKAPSSEQEVNLTSIIKAAVYAGSIYDTDAAKVLKDLKDELAEYKYQIPTDNVLQKIIEAVKDI